MNTIQLVVFDIAGTTVQDRGSVADAFLAAFREFGFTIPEEEVKRVMGFRKIDAVRQLLDKFAPMQGGKEGGGASGRGFVQEAGEQGQSDKPAPRRRVGKARSNGTLPDGHTEEEGSAIGEEPLPDPELDREMLIDRIHTRFIDNMISFYRNDEQLAPFPHAEKVFSRLKKLGIKVALNTGFTRAIADTILHRLRWDDRFDAIDLVICSDEVPHGRPHPDMIHTLARELGISSPDHVLKVGDTEVDVEEGRNAGCGIVVSVTTGAYTRAQLEQYHPDYIIDDLQDILPIIEKS